ncbi:hypothetical protein EJ04DRAFT_339411 [Polyplosphaeria fusca]|uniref:Secreted protein n=1 Tax=Polyplosphaeria fusca TaxID=682080 RepID=A0A9P4QW90_9PLEO|nr:hypothetical protein EJ04DRAFT_339411 [Polyplosphaeria fusca]
MSKLSAYTWFLLSAAFRSSLSVLYSVPYHVTYRYASRGSESRKAVRDSWCIQIVAAERKLNATVGKRSLLPAYSGLRSTEALRIRLVK